MSRLSRNVHPCRLALLFTTCSTRKACNRAAWRPVVVEALHCRYSPADHASAPPWLRWRPAEGPGTPTPRWVLPCALGDTGGRLRGFSVVTRPAQVMGW